MNINNVPTKNNRNHILGTYRELKVRADLLNKGFETFSQDGPFSFDMIAHKDGHCARIEVKGAENGNRKPMGPFGGYSSLTSKGMAVKFDIKATVMEDDTIVYQRSVFCSLPNPVVLELTKENEEYSSKTSNRYKNRYKKDS